MAKDAALVKILRDFLTAEEALRPPDGGPFKASGIFVAAFPKNSQAKDLMTNAPGIASEEQLRELHIRLRNPVKI